ncbi:hypothetical protein [Aureliella helgolandensis]|uniref:Uncharacterized protein n=1 Tax=Aureliella helgolandensis TaxID=2527968 RepID=A0A518GDS4_9BACT|nr:hypothetical protein [Aureliella helgolandensis]QDV26754.1 hypothetical protein Q31a_51330 [Aureliella helgolandensis]
MPTYALVLLILITWLAYPAVGIISLRAAIARGDRPPDAGFSYLPELIIYPPLFFGFAMLVDFFVMPWGRLLVGLLCVIMLVLYAIDVGRNLAAIRRIEDRT